MGRLSDKLAACAKGGYLPMHMPGHKRRYKGEDPFFRQLYERDITEIDGFDDLHDPSGIIKELEAEAARLMGAGEAAYLVNGSTAGVMAAICAAVPEGGRLIMERSSHMSAYNAVILRHITPLYIYGEIDEYGIGRPVSARELKAAGPADAIFLTTPSYEGDITELKEIAEYAHGAGMKLIVDAAHGAHFCMGAPFPANALRMGADIEVISLHKTLKAPTQTALIGMADPDERAAVSAYLDMFQSSSPSYLLMAGMEEGIKDALGCGSEAKEAWMKQRLWLQEELMQLKNMSAAPLEGRDPYKLTILLKDKCSGICLSDILRERYGIICEMALPSYVVMICTMSDEKADYKRLAAALKETDMSGDISRGSGNVRQVFKKKRIRYAPGEAHELPAESVSLADAAGRTAAGLITAYPPGRVLAVPGEIIDDECTADIEYLKKKGVSVRGVDEYGRIRVIRE